MEKPIAVFDADEVIFPTLDMINGILKHTFGIIMQPGDWHTYNIWCNPKTKHVADKLIKKLQNGNYFAELIPMFGAIYGLNRVAEKYRIIISTRRQPIFYEQTVYTFEKHCLPFEEIYCGEDKIKVVRRVRPIYFVDDLLDEHMSVLPYRNENKAFKQIINTRPWNNFYFDKRFLRAYDWIKKYKDRKTIPEWLIKGG